MSIEHGYELNYYFNAFFFNLNFLAQIKESLIKNLNIFLREFFMVIVSDSSASSSAEVTLNALNAGENEVDVESLSDFGNGEVR